MWHGRDTVEWRTVEWRTVEWLTVEWLTVDRRTRCDGARIIDG